VPGTEVTISTPMAPTAWAVLERELLRANAIACREFFQKYFDERGYLKCVERWGGDDGPDDAIENLSDWPILHALGASDNVLDMYKKGWEGHLRQYTAARTKDVPFARDGMYYKEFPVMFDWLHNGEGLTVFDLQGLSDPDPKYLLLASGGQMGCGPGLDPSADDSTGAESAVSAAAGAGFPTFVLGVVDPTSEVAATGTLNHMAIVGNEAQQNSSTSFYRVTDLSVLTEVTSARTSFGIGCTIALETSVAGAVLSVSAITTAGTTVAIPQDAANGWSYDAGGRNLILNGSVCTALQASAYSVVSLRYDCGG